MIIDERADAISRTLTVEQGRTLPEWRSELERVAEIFTWYAEEEA